MVLKGICSVVLLSICVAMLAQSTDTLQQPQVIKKGLSFGIVPAIGFDSDIGIKYGGIVNLFWYGNGLCYPRYNHSLMVEWSETTKGSGTKQLVYDSEQLIPGIRVSGEASYFTEKAMDFYGFNGYNAYYNSKLVKDNSQEYLSRMFYKINRKLTRIRIDLQGKFGNTNFGWIGGWMYENFCVDSVDVNKLNKGLSSNRKLPFIGGGLYGDYVNWGMIGQNERTGGDHHLLRMGLTFDSRDNEPNPMKGMWTELVYVLSPAFTGTATGFTRLVATHRQYITLIKRKLSLTGRLSYQATLTGHQPWYMLSTIQNFGPSYNRDGLGGAKTLRGILRARIVGDDFVYGNVECRWKFLKTIVFNQNLHLTLAPFLDFGRVTKKYQLPENITNEAKTYLQQGSPEVMHYSVGISGFTAMNENFVAGIQYGHALDKRDGGSGVYIVMNFMY
jgi:hypothetical protein